jgi:hypothetical protein
MSLDFLRRLAFDGELSGFIRDDPYQFAERATGVGLRFEPDFLADVASNAREDYVGVRTNWHQRADFGAILARAVDEIWSGDDRALARYRSYYYAGDKPKDRRSIVHIVVDLPTEGDPLLVDGPRSYEGFTIRYRVSGEIEAQYGCGSAIQTGASRGTLSLFLYDPQALRSFALTCGHVAPLAGTIVSSPAGGVSLGPVLASTVPAATGACNKHAHAGATVDAALVEVQAPATFFPGGAKVLRPIAQISDGDLVEFHGQGSRQQRPAMVMAATIWKRMKVNGGSVCCGDIFEISHRTAPYVGSPLSRPGDSGAPVLAPGAGASEWLGVLIGGERSSSYCCYAEHVMDWANGQVTGVALLP